MAADPNHITWASLLAVWMDFARSAVALPKDADGSRWRGSVAPIIGLQAVTFALGDIDALEGSGGGERAFGLDRAEVLIGRFAAELHALWRGEALPAELGLLIEDARRALRAAKDGGTEWVAAEDRMVIGDPMRLIERVVGTGFAGDLWLAQPGTIVSKRTPVAFLHQPGGGPAPGDVLEIMGGELPGCEPGRAPARRQVYRQGRTGSEPVRDVVTPMDETLPIGRPLLVLVIEKGHAHGNGTDRVPRHSDPDPVRRTGVPRAGSENRGSQL